MARKLIRPTLKGLGIQKSRQGRFRKKAKRRERNLTHGLPIAKKHGVGIPTVVTLDDGEEVVGKIEWYDRDCIKVNREGEPNLLIMRRCIKCIARIDGE